MWVQDAAAMYTYAQSTAAATQLAPFTAPPQTTNSAAATGQHSAVAQAASTSAGGVQSLLSQLGGLTSGAPFAPAAAGTPAPAIPSGLTPVLNLLSPSSPLSIAAEALGTSLRGISVGSVGLVNPIFGLNLGILAMQAAISQAGTSAAFSPALATVTAELGAQTGTTVPIVSANAGGAVLAGGLSVPPSWTAATPTMKLVASGLQGTSTSTAPAAAVHGAEGLLSQITLAGVAGGALGRAIAPAVNVTSVRRADMAPDKDGSKPSKFDRVLTELSKNPESVQHWHTDKAQLESLLEQLSKKPGTHAVHVHIGGDKKSTPSKPESTR
jgi:PPE-repeat protein